jgi:hypothetical protein
MASVDDRQSRPVVVHITVAITVAIVTAAVILGTQVTAAVILAAIVSGVPRVVVPQILTVAPVLTTKPLTPMPFCLPVATRVVLMFAMTRSLTACVL